MHHDPSHADCADDGCGTGLRNRYYAQKPLRSADYAIEQRYGIDRRRLLNRAVVGWGVGYGFAVEVAGGLRVGTGFALDRHGRELVRIADGALVGADIRLLGDLAADQRRAKDGQNPEGITHHCVLSAHYAERGQDRVRLGDDCCDGGSAWNHVCEGVVFSLRPYCGDCPPGEPRCPRCTCKGWHPDAPPEHPSEPPSAEPYDEAGMLAARKTRDGTTNLPVTTEQTSDTRPVPHHGDRGPHCCLSEWVTGRDADGDCVPLCVDGDVAFDPGDGVPLACVDVWFDDCGCPVFGDAVDTCTPRRLIKNNDLLFDLIRGCDLTHISDIGWREYHLREERIAWKEFRHLLGDPPTGKGTERATHFVVSFSGPVRVETLTRYAFIVRCITGSTEGWRQEVRVPVTRVEALRPADGLALQARIWINDGWHDQEVIRAESRLSRPFAVEIEVRCDLILDCAGQAVDGNPVGLRPAPSGNGTPGGTYLSVFRVEAKPNNDRYDDGEE